MTLNRQLRYSEHDRQSLLNGVNGPGGHVRGGVPVVGSNDAAGMPSGSPWLGGPQFVDDPGWDAASSSLVEKVWRKRSSAGWVAPAWNRGTPGRADRSMGTRSQPW